MTVTEILATGPDLVKIGLRGIEPVIEEIIMEANQEIQLLVYVFTPKAIHLLKLLEHSLERGIDVTIVINSLSKQNETIKTELNLLKSKYDHLKIINLFEAENHYLHAKLVVVDRKKAVVGSANFTWGGMYGNYEVGLLVEGEQVWKLAEIHTVIQRLLR